MMANQIQFTMFTNTFPDKILEVKNSCIQYVYHFVLGF